MRRRKKQTIRTRHHNAYPIGYGRLWGEGAWTATDLVHRPGSANAVARGMAQIVYAMAPYRGGSNA